MKAAAQQVRAEVIAATLIALGAAYKAARYSVGAVWSTGGPVFSVLGFVWVLAALLGAVSALTLLSSVPAGDGGSAWRRSERQQRAAKVWAIVSAVLLGVCAVAAWFIEHPHG